MTANTPQFIPDANVSGKSIKGTRPSKGSPGTSSGRSPKCLRPLRKGTTSPVSTLEYNEGLLIRSRVSGYKGRVFAILNGEIKEISGEIRRESDQSLNGNDQLPPFAPLSWNADRDVTAISEEVSRTAEYLLDTEGDAIWDGMIDTMVRANGPIPNGLGKTGEEIAKLRNDRKRLEKEGKRAKGSLKKTGAEIEAERARNRAAKKAGRKDQNAKSPTNGKGLITSRYVIFTESEKDPATKRVFEFLYQNTPDMPVPSDDDAAKFLDMLQWCATEIILMYWLRKIHQNPTIQSIAEAKVLTLVKFPALPDPEIRKALARSAARAEAKRNSR